MPWAGNMTLVAALPEPNVPVGNGSYSQMPALLGGDLFWVVALGFALFLLLGLGVWIRYRSNPGNARIGSVAKRGRRRRSSRSNPTLADVGGLPPPKQQAAGMGSEDASQ